MYGYPIKGTLKRTKREREKKEREKIENEQARHRTTDEGKKVLQQWPDTLVLIPPHRYLSRVAGR